MFVPEYTNKGGQEYKITLWDSKHNIVYLQYADGVNSLSSCSTITSLGMEPIYIKCPHCGNMLNQSGKVECDKCGWAAEAISEAQFMVMFNQVDDSIGFGMYTHVESTIINVNGVPYLPIYYINGLRWLKTKRGR